MEQTINSAKQNMEKTLSYLKAEFLKFRTGKAHPSLIDDLKIEYYGTKTPLKHLATTTVSGPRALIIQPYDKNVLKNIEASVSTSNLGLKCVIEGERIKVWFPELTEERRKEMVSALRQKLEEARVSVRNAREEAWRKIKDLEKEGKITEDDKYKAQDKLNELVAEYNSKIEEMGKNKEKEIMTV